MRALPRSLTATAALLIACGGEDLFVVANLDRDENCEYVADNDNAITGAELDLAGGGYVGSEACLRPLLAHLLVENPNSDTALVHGAQVKLMSTNHQTIIFNRGLVSLPNPFLVRPNAPLPAEADGVVALEGIPTDFAKQLQLHFGELLAVIELFATTAGGDEIESNAFSLPVALCDGCRTLCRTAAAAEDVGECSDRELGDEREFCIDDGC